MYHVHNVGTRPCLAWQRCWLCGSCTSSVGISREADGDVLLLWFDILFPQLHLFGVPLIRLEGPDLGLFHLPGDPRLAQPQSRQDTAGRIQNNSRRFSGFFCCQSHQSSTYPSLLVPSLFLIYNLFKELFIIIYTFNISPS